MLAGNEFTVGTLADTRPLSLMLPRSKHEQTFLVGGNEKEPTAVSVGGSFNFHCFECSNAINWMGLLIPKVSVEVDETSLFDPNYTSAPLGSIVRTDTRLVILAKTEGSFGRHSQVTLVSELPLASDLSAAFSKWRIVIGNGQDKRVLKEIDTEK